MPDPLLQAVKTIRRQSDAVPRAGIILGSGLGGIADEITDCERFPYGDLPGLVPATAEGHRGELILGRLDGVIVAAFAGRLHRYEGHNDAQVCFPVQLAAALGAERLIVSNAAGGLNPLLRVGDIVVIRDHIDLGKSGLREPADYAEPSAGRLRTSRRAAGPLYHSGLIDAALAAARRGDFRASEGIYIAVRGPTYETRAEYRMLQRFGGDVVGMSTAPEVDAACRLGLKVLGLSLVSNAAKSDIAQPTDHEEVLAAGRRAAGNLRELVKAALVYNGA